MDKPNAKTIGQLADGTAKVFAQEIWDACDLKILFDDEQDAKRSLSRITDFVESSLKIVIMDTLELIKLAIKEH